jgi:cytochrome oxidase assembly protein ShyY1
VLKFLLKPKWVALTLLVLLLQPGFWALSQWQWRRLHQRVAYNSVIVQNQSQSPAPLVKLIKPVGQNLKLEDSVQWRPVEIIGTWDVAHQVLVRKQSYASNLGFWVVTPLTSTAGLTVLVNRGWIAAGNSALNSPTVSAPPKALVQIVGRIRLVTARTSSRPTDLPTGQVDAIQPQEVISRSALVVNAYLELTASDPQSLTADLQPILAPEIDEGPHRSYALQWIFFAIMTVIGWVILVRKEITDTASPEQENAQITNS